MMMLKSIRVFLFNEKKLTFDTSGERAEVV